MANKDGTTIGCIFGSFALTRLIVITPMWLYFVYRVLTLCEADKSDWIVFWIYVVSTIVLGLIESCAKAIYESVKAE